MLILMILPQATQEEGYIPVAYNGTSLPNPKRADSLRYERTAEGSDH
jgi:hypothetical protein